METRQMERVVEPELMEDEDQALAYAQADFSTSDAAIVERIQALFPVSLGGNVLDLGCGPGNICHRLALAFPSERILGVDGSSAMLHLARQRRDEAGLSTAHLDYQEAFLPTAALPERNFTAVISNSLLHHLHDPSVLWRTLLQVAAPGARVYIKDLRRPSSPVETEALVARYVSEEPQILQVDFRNSLYAAFTLAEVQAQLSQHGLEHLQAAAVDDRYLEIWGTMPG